MKPVDITIETAITAASEAEYNDVTTILEMNGFQNACDNNPDCNLIIVWTKDMAFGNYYNWQSHSYPTIRAVDFIETYSSNSLADTTTNENNCEPHSTNVL